MPYQRPHRHHHRGAVLVLFAILLVVCMGVVAFAIDIGLLTLSRNEAQRAADAAALAAGHELMAGLQTDNVRKRLDRFQSQVETSAVTYGSLNSLSGSGAKIIPAEDVVIGTLINPENPQLGVEPANLLVSNTVQVTVRADAARTNPIPFFFAPFLGISTGDVRARAIVRFAGRMGGVKVNSSTTLTPLLPFTFHVNEWRYQVDEGNGPDTWSYDESSGTVSPGADGVPEFVFFPIGSGSGNWGTIDIGEGGNSSTDLQRQILEGVNDTDLSAFGGQFAVDPAVGYLEVNGDTGVDATLEDPLRSIIGQPRVIPLFETFTGTGNNCLYHVVGFAGIRIVDVCLKGSSKYVTAQPASIEHASIVYANLSTSDFVVERLRLVD
jgi:Flp pilus assembly protein TadG